MDKAYFRKLRPLLHALVIGVCAGAFVSCSMEDDNGPCPVTTEQPVVMHIGAQQPPAVRAEEDAARGENIHSLWVFLVDAGNKVEWKLEVDNLDDVKDYYSDPVENLTTGAKTLYAFANFDAYLTPGDALYNEALAKLLALEKGAAFNADGIMIDDPAANISLGDVNKRIPMSGKAAVTVAVNTSEIGVGMDRLVSKVRISLDASAGESGTVTFGGTSSSVSLMQGGTVSSAGTLTERTVTFDNNISGTKIPDFYVNATEETGIGFSVKLETTDFNGNKVTYSATTQRKDLPRNCIYPLNLNFPAFAFTLSAQAWLAPIGEFQLVVDKPNETRYSVNLPQGCTYKFGFSGTGVQNLAVTWPAVADYGDYSVTESAGNSVSGAVSAAASVNSTFEMPFNVTFTATVNGITSNFSRTYILEVTVLDIWEFPLWQPAQILPSEALDMYKN